MIERDHLPIHKLSKSHSYQVRLLFYCHSMGKGKVYFHSLLITVFHSFLWPEHGPRNSVSIFRRKVFVLGSEYSVSPLGRVLVNVPFEGFLTKSCVASTYCFEF